MPDGTRRSAGQGSVYRTKTGDRRWRGALILVHPMTGEQTRRFVSGKTKKATEAALDKLRAEVSSGAFPSGETVGEFLTRWLVAVKPRLRPATFQGYSQHVRDHWTPILGLQLTRLTPSDVEHAMAALLGRGLSPLTVLHARSTLRRALHDAQRDGLITRNAAGLARPPRAERKEMRALSPVEVRTLIAATKDDEFGPIYALAVGSGLRLGELLGLEWSDVDLEAGLLTVRRAMARTSDGGWGLAPPKTSRSRRTVMLPTIAREALERQQARQEAARTAAGTAWQDRDDLVFTDSIGRPLNSTIPSRTFRTAADRLSLPVRFHDLRHSAASLMLSAGTPLKVVSDALGHSTIAITADVYAHVTPELRREAADAMDRALAETD